MSAADSAIGCSLIITQIGYYATETLHILSSVKRNFRE